MVYYTCPICGYESMTSPPDSENICSCCGTEFGVDDYYHTQEELRQMWIQQGFPWFDDITRPPKDWQPQAQLTKAGLLA
jgi:hypothetical protein